MATHFSILGASLVAQDDKESACNVVDLGSIPGLGRSRREENSYPLQHSDLENSMDCTVYGVAKSQTRLRNFHFHTTIWRRKWQPIPIFLPGKAHGQEETGGLQSMGSQKSQT